MMKTKCMIISGLVATIFVVGAVAAPLNELAVHYAVKIDQAPIIDGRLDETSWQKAPKFTRYRQVRGENHQATNIQILWDENGLYLGIGNYEAHLDRLKATVRTRDGGDIWADDSAEIYIDPTATGYSMFKFDLNSIGTIADFWQVDPGFIDYSWSASSARAAGDRTSDAWVLEFFVSWSDLIKNPETGDVWMFFHRRLAYTGLNGALTDSSSSGGSYHNRRFGYLYFIDRKLPSAQELGEKLIKLARPPWALPLNGQWLFAESNQAITAQKAATIIQKLREQAQTALKSVNDLAKKGVGEAESKRIKALNERFAAADKLSGEFERMAEYKAISDVVPELFDEVALSEFIK